MELMDELLEVGNVGVGRKEMKATKGYVEA